MGMIMLSCMCLNAQLVGSPSVDYTVDEVGTDFITITFTPNADAAGYAICLFEAGTAEQQFAMFGQWMGFQTMGDQDRGVSAHLDQPGTWQGLRDLCPVLGCQQRGCRHDHRSCDH